MVRGDDGVAIYGTAILAACLLAGVATGTLLGKALGLDTDVGGVGLAMLLLVLVTDRLRRAGRLGPESQSGISYWSALYIPIVVAMAASQNVRGALSGGMVALVAGSGCVVICLALVGVLSRPGRGKDGTGSGTDG